MLVTTILMRPCIMFLGVRPVGNYQEILGSLQYTLSGPNLMIND